MAPGDDTDPGRTVGVPGPPVPARPSSPQVRRPRPACGRRSARCSSGCTGTPASIPGTRAAACAEYDGAATESPPPTTAISSEATALGERALRAALARRRPARRRSGPADRHVGHRRRGARRSTPGSSRGSGCGPTSSGCRSSASAASPARPALRRLHDYLLGWPGHTAALLAVELCSLAVPLTGRHDGGPGGQRPVRRRRGGGDRDGRARPPAGSGARGSSPRAARCTRTAATRWAGGWARTASASC